MPKNPTPKNEAATKRLIKDTLTDKVENHVLQGIIPQQSRTAELYGLPKDHKPDVPLRPIVSACGDPLDNLTSLLENIISQLLQYVPAHLRNTEEYLGRLEQAFPNHCLPAGSIIFSVDVVNLYGNIPVEDAIKATSELLNQHRDSLDMRGLSVGDVERLLRHCLSNNFLRFGDQYFRQTTGIAMGSRVAPPLAIVFMDSLERKYLEESHYKPSIYMRYIDDVLAVWTHGEDRLQEFLQHINTAHPSINFTIETTVTNGSIPFLDTKISMLPDDKYSTELYIKPTSSEVIINFQSAQPMQMKKAVLNAQIRRATRLSSDAQAQRRSLERITTLFQSNGYPHKLILSSIKNIQSNKKTDRNHRAPSKRISLPYIDDGLAHKINGILRNSGLNMQPAWSNKNTIKKHLVKSALQPPPCPGGGRACNTCLGGLEGRCHVTGVIYHMTCTLCNKHYIGETGRMIRQRYNEHLGDARNRRENTPWGLHFQCYHQNTTPSPDIIRIKILKQISYITDRKIGETTFLRDLQPAINTQASSWLLAA